jgi:hypothetical protein
MVYFIFTGGEVFVDQEQQRDEELQQQRGVAAEARVKALGFRLDPENAVARNQDRCSCLSGAFAC